ncbi:MAG: HAD-IB family hydrolase [Polyangia bacterium]
MSDTPSSKPGFAFATDTKPGFAFATDTKPGAAFFDVDGTLIETNIVHAFAWYARHQPTLLGSAKKTLKTALSLPFFAVADRISRKAFNELFYAYYEGESEDRLHVLAEELFEDVVRPAIYARTPALLAQARRAGLKLVIVSGGLDFIVRPLAQHLGVDDFIASSLEFSRGHATGRLGKPLVAGTEKAVLIREYAEKHGIDLSRSHAYTDSYADYAMLTVVGHPAAVNPDLRLRTVARSHDWPIIELGADRGGRRTVMQGLVSRLADRLAPRE